MNRQCVVEHSDIDMVVYGDWPSLPMRTLARALEKNNIPSDMRIIDKARVMPTNQRRLAFKRSSLCATTCRSPSSNSVTPGRALMLTFASIRTRDQKMRRTLRYAHTEAAVANTRYVVAFLISYYAVGPTG